MKKLRSPLIAALAGVLAGALICLLFTQLVFPPDAHGADDEYRLPSGSQPSEAQLTAIALEAAEYLERGDTSALSELVHPDYGLVFSPFATVNLSSNLCFSVRDVAKLAENGDKLTWGVRTDGGEPISMTFSEYRDTYIDGLDYTNAPIIGVDYIVRTGNALENVTESFPGAHFVDLCYPGTEEAGYNDWSILRLVFEEYQSTLRLTAVIHSEATI